MTSHRIGVNLRVSGNCDQGGRKYMEDYHAIKFVKKDDRDYEFAYFGIFDGHGGPEASRFARDNLLNEITKYEQFWSEDDEEVKFAIRSGFLDTHQAMWKELDKWPRTMSGLPSTSGTTASIAIVKKGKLYIGHVGDSGIVMGCDEGPRNAIFMKPLCLTKDHKPDNPEEKERIEKCGGAVVAKAGVQRVVWCRPKVTHKGPVRRSTQIDKIPFLAVARSLGDLWSYDYYKGQFVVSPDPDVSAMTIEPGHHRSLVLGSDGLWNMLSPSEAVSVVTDLEMHFEDRVIHDPMVSVSYWINPAEKLVTRALSKWRAKMMKADNISCIVVLIDPLGPSKLTLLRKRREDHFAKVKEANDLPDAEGETMKKSTPPVVSGSSSMTSQSVATSVPNKDNQNQNNLGLGDRENYTNSSGTESVRESHRSSCKGDSDDDAENQSQMMEGESASAGCSLSGHSHSASNTFVGRDITLTTNQTAVNNTGGGLHPVPNPSSLVPPAALKATSTSKPIHAPVYRGHQALLACRMTGVAGSCPGDNKMDDSIQATSTLASLTSVVCIKTVSPSKADTALRRPASTCADGGGLASMALSHLSPVSMSSSLLQLMSLDAVKAQSKPVPRKYTSLMSSASEEEIVGERAKDGRDPGKSRRSNAMLQNSALPFQEQNCASYSLLLSSSSDSSSKCVNNPSMSAANKTVLHSRSSLNLSSTRFTHLTRSLDKTFHSARALQLASSQSVKGSLSPADCPKQQLYTPTTSKSKNRHTDSSKALRTLSLHSSARRHSGKKDKKHHFGLFNRTRSTLLRARNAARKALCPENRTFLKQLPGSKRKSEEKHAVLGTPSKRLRRSDVQHS